MNNGVEMLLKVDAFAEAIGGDENVPLARGEFGNLLLAFIVAVVAGNRLDMEARELTAEELAQPLGDIVGRWDEAAKDDRPITVAHQIPKDLGELRKLVILFWPGERSRAITKGPQSAAIVRSADAVGFFERPGWSVVGYPDHER